MRGAGRCGFEPRRYLGRRVGLAVGSQALLQLTLRLHRLLPADLCAEVRVGQAVLGVLVQERVALLFHDLDEPR